MIPVAEHFVFCRRVAFALFGVLNGTEVNPEFEAQVAALEVWKCGSV